MSDIVVENGVVENGVGESVFVTLKDDDSFIEAAGLQKTKYSGRKSSVEKLLEESLGTLDISAESQSSHSPIDSPSYQPSSPKKITSPSRGSDLQNLNDDSFIADAGLNKSGTVRTRKSSRERLLEEELNTFEPPPPQATTNSENISRSQSIDSRKMSDCSDGRKISTGSEASGNSTEQQEQRPRRRSSVYQQKQIEAPTATKGNRIAARTQNLFQQYEKDYHGTEKKPMINIDDELADTEIGLGTRKASYSKATRDEPKTDGVKLAKERELNEVRQLYQQRLIEEEQEVFNKKHESNSNMDVKYTRPLGDVRQRYLRSASGGSTQDDEQDELYDDKGTKIERSGGKIDIVSSSNSVKNIKNHFGSIGKAGWKKRQLSSENVDSNSVNSARNLFKNIESKKEESQTYNRPIQRKVKDPKELMEMRKKLTYGNDTDEIPQDGIVKKTVVIENTELGDKKRALDLYRTLERSTGSNLPVQKPRTRLLSDTEAKFAMDVKRESEGSDDAHNETVSGYGSGGTPCSPVSSVSDDYSTFPDQNDISVNVSIDISKDINENEELIVNKKLIDDSNVSHAEFI